MTRKEDIIQTAKNKYPYIKGLPQNTSNQAIFIEAAEWADKSIIEKACEYLRRHMYYTPIFEHDKDEDPVNYVCASCCDSVEDFIDNFRKSMEE